MEADHGRSGQRFRKPTGTVRKLGVDDGELDDILGGAPVERIQG